jgi:hypothetical protein
MKHRQARDLGSRNRRRLAWVPFSGGNYQQARLATGTNRKPRSATFLTELYYRSTGSLVGGGGVEPSDALERFPATRAGLPFVLCSGGRPRAS